MGCATLTQHDDPNDAIALLEEALAAGITHFDVAPQYGFGQAEGILGRFLKGKRDRVTVATKFGLMPSAALAKHRGMVSVARRLARRSRVFSALANRILRRTGKRSYDPADARQSLEKSLQELGTDYVDLFLLHDCSPADAARDELRHFLEEEQRRGRIRTYGLATSFEKLGDDAAIYPADYRILQFDDSARAGHVARLGNAQDRAIITYGATRRARSLAAAAQANPERLAGHAAVGHLTDASVVGALLLRLAMDDNPQGVVLFATTRAEHLRANVRFAAQGQTLSAAQRTALVEFARSIPQPA
ncbi:MAG: NADP-dependent oxidoreductase domain protein [Phycisphaerales bacterium]|nr:NADP-dependent oxidoreductase domain protein [Phycisphaerales bacterium]